MNFDYLFEENYLHKIPKRDIETLKDYLIAKKGWIYVMQSKDNNQLKIGRTGKSPFERSKSLSNTGVFHDYVILYAHETYNQFITENLIKDKLKKYRVKKEFYNLNKDFAISTIASILEDEKLKISRYLLLDIINDDIELIDLAIK